MNERIVHANGVDLAVVEAGVGGKPLLLVHGFGGAKEDFTHYLDRFGALGWHAVTLDNRGHGSSAKPDDEAAYSLAILADDLDALMTALGWTDATILGHSMGGMVVQVLWLAHPDRFNALILMDTSPAIPDAVDADLIAAAQELVRVGGMEAFVALGDAATEPGPLDTAAYLKMVAEDPAYAEFSRNKSLNTLSAAWVALAGDMAQQHDRTEALRAVAVPTLVIVGEQDAGFMRQSEAMANAIPNAKLIVIPEAGHSPQFEAPAAWWDAITGFLATLG